MLSLTLAPRSRAIQSPAMANTLQLTSIAECSAEPRPQMSTASHLPYTILLDIFAEADVKTRGVATSVCRWWLEPAQYILWSDLPSPIPLFRLLGQLTPVTREAGSRLRFSASPSFEKWDRFVVLSNLVRSLTYNDEEARLHPSVFHEIAMTRPVGHLLPRLRELNLIIDDLDRITECVVLLSPTITDFSLVTQGNHRRRCTAFINQMRRMPCLRRLTLHHTLVSPAARAAFFQLLEASQHLEEINLKTTDSVLLEVFEKLHRLPNLVKVNIPQMFMAKALPERPSSPKPIPFDDLHDLQLNFVDYRVMKRIFLDDSFVDLKELRVVVMVENDDPEGWSSPDLLTAIANACPNLTLLHVEYGLPEDATDIRPLGFSALKPIISKLKLRHFALEHPLPLDLSQAEVTRIAEAMGDTVVSLRLNPLPFPGQAATLPHAVFEGGQYLGLDALLPFAQSCPNLESLALYVDTRTAINPPPLWSVTFPASFTSLAFGDSPIESPAAVVAYLNSLVRGPVSVDHDSKDVKRELAWNQVSVMMDILAVQYQRLTEATVKLERGLRL